MAETKTQKKVIIPIRTAETIQNRLIYLIPVDEHFLPEIKQVIIAGYKQRETEVEFTDAGHV